MCAWLNPELGRYFAMLAYIFELARPWVKKIYCKAGAYFRAGLDPCLRSFVAGLTFGFKIY